MARPMRCGALMVAAVLGCGGSSAEDDGSATPAQGGPTPPTQAGPGTPPAPADPATPAKEGPPTIAGCPLFPADDPWNQDVSREPTDPRSAAYVSREDPQRALRLGFGVEEFYGVPVYVVPADQPLVPITFGTDGLDFSAESDRGPFPVPVNAQVQGGRRGEPIPADGDRHLVVVQEKTCRAYELFNTVRDGGGFRVSSAVWWDLRSRSWPRRPTGWTSADGAGLPLLPGLIRAEEVSSGAIRHAIRFTAPRVRKAFVSPANHCGPTDDPDLLPFGARLRLRADFDVSPYSGATRVVLEALKRYGMYLSDVGTAWTLGGTSDPSFHDLVRELRDRPVPGTAFEVLRLGDVHTGC